jgi:UPF0755 protein
MKKALLFLLALVFLAALYAAWGFFGPTVNAPEGKYFYIRTGSSYEAVKKQVQSKQLLKSIFFFDLVARQADYTTAVKPGRYEVKKGSSVVDLVRMLKSGRQAPVRLVINKLRTKEDLAQKLAANFETDSASVMKLIASNDSLQQYDLDTNTVMTTVIPNTYLLQWNSPAKKIFNRLRSEQEKFWTDERKQKARNKNLSTTQVYTIASIVEEETNMEKDKGLIASVYINRMNKGMKLEADPTVKYAHRNFALTRILSGHLQYPSPYNTYRNTGLPPGPICTPSPKTIDAVLDAPQTDYIFFVAKPDFKGYSNFATNYQDHLVFANAYRKALDSLFLARQKK